MVYIIPLEKSIKPIEISAKFTQSVGAIDIRSNQSIHFTGTLPEDLYTFVYTGKSRGRHTWHGSAFDQAIIETSGKNYQVDDLVIGQTDVRIVLIRKNLMQRFLQDSGKDLALYYAEHAYSIVEKDIDLFLDMHARILAKGNVSDKEVGALVLRILQKPATDKALPEQGYDLVNTAIGLMKEHTKSPFLISELADILDVNIRTLELAFNKHFQISPKAYYKRLLLQIIEIRLRGRDSNETNVADVLAEYQIYNLSQFGLSFKNYFKKTPASIGTLSDKENPFGWNEKIFAEFA